MKKKVFDSLISYIKWERKDVIKSVILTVYAFFASCAGSQIETSVHTKQKGKWTKFLLIWVGGPSQNLSMGP